MNYLTNYYKNLSEQLQERVNHLQNLLNEVVITKIGLDGKAEKIDTSKGEKFKEPGPANGLSAEENKIEKELDAEDEARDMSAFYHARQTQNIGPEGTAESRAQAQVKANQEAHKKNAKNQGNVGPSAGRKQ